MEREIDLHLRLSYDVRALRPWLTLVLLSLLAGDLASENVSLTTYYPAPSGVYAQLISTNNTWLARDAGYLDVATTLIPVAGTKMVVMGGVGVNTTDVSAGGTVGSGFTVNTAGYATGMAIVSGTGAGSQRWAINAAGGGWTMFDGGGGAWNSSMTGLNGNIGIHQPAPIANLDDGGTARFNSNVTFGATAPTASGRGYVFVDNTNTGCVQTSITGDVLGAACGGGQYITAQPGFYIEGWSYFNRGGQVLAQTGAGQATTQVWGLNNCSGGGVGCTGNPTWMTLKKDDSTMALYCCPK